MRKLTILIFCLLTLNLAAKDNYLLKSPNGKLSIEIDCENGLHYSLLYNGEKLLQNNAIALLLEDGTLWSGKDVRAKAATRSVSEQVVSPLYRTSSFNATYNELNLDFKKFGVIFRLYDSGAAYRFYTLNREQVIIKNEVVEFNIDQNRVCYVPYSKGRTDKFAHAFQNTYTVDKIENLPDNIAFLPLTVAYNEQLKLTILESDLESYPGMSVTTEGKTIKGEFAKYPSKVTLGENPRAMTIVKAREDYIAKIDSSRELPWRVMAVTQQDIDMPTNNLVYALASPNRLDDYSWIKGGQSTWDWWNDWGTSKVDFKFGLNTQSYKHYIDFAAENGIKYVTIDEGWYHPGSGDMMNIVDDIDIEEIVEYGKQRDVGIILWCVFNVLDDNLEQISAHYSKIGVKGFKIDFLDRDDQTAVEMVYRIAEVTAKHKLFLDLHGVYKPTGINRTYPNVVNTESVFGMEEVKWSRVESNMPLYDVTFPYIRMMSGFVDYTPGAMRNATKKNFQPIFSDPMSMGTRAHQVATYVVYDSPLTMLADNTTAYRNDRECLDFITSIPTCDITTTKVLQGVMGEYIVTARQFDDNWFVGGLTNWDGRTIELDLSFLSDGRYTLSLFKDGVNSDKVASDYVIENFEVNSSSKIDIIMTSGGGFVARIIKQ